MKNNKENCWNKKPENVLKYKSYMEISQNKYSIWKKHEIHK